MKFFVYLACLIGSVLTLDMTTEQSTTSLVTTGQIPTAVITADQTSTTVINDAAARSSKGKKKKSMKKKKKHGGKGKKSPPETSSPEYWFDQKLDHSATNSPTWKQRYFLNEGFFKGGESPIFLDIEGEWVATNDTAHNPEYFMNYLAKKHKAMVVVVEHRFYGKSQPTPDWSIQNLKYLSAEQALADLVAIQDYIIRTKKISTKSKWFVGGASYAGQLAAWAKLKYPNRFAGALASSAPVLATTNFYQYADKVAFGLKYFGGDKCLSDIKPALQEFHRLVGSPNAADQNTLNSLFQFCEPLKNDLDRGYAEAWIAWSMMGVAQGNDWNEYTLKNICSDFDSAKPGTPLEKLATFIHSLSEIGPDDCMNVDYQEDVVDWLSNISIGVTDYETWLPWYYQWCNEFGTTQSTADSTSMFGVLKYNNENFALTDTCKQVFGITDTRARIAATNQKYGGLNINAANIIFSNGNIDGWSTLSLIDESRLVNPLSKVVYIDGTSHCRDWYIDEATDSGPIVWAHEQIARHVKNILKK